MRILYVFFICFLMYCAPAEAIGRRHRYTGQPRTEVELMSRVLDCLRNKDTAAYYNLFPPFDTLWNLVNHNADQTPEAQTELAKLREHPTVLIDLDPYYNQAIMGRYAYVLGKGEDSGINWKGIVMQRFELQKQGLSRGMEGLQHIAPERFKGFLFVRDMLSSTTYCITITEIQKVKEFYTGGQVLNVLEAKDIDEYLARESAERKYLAKQSKLAEQKADSVKANGGGDGSDTTSDSYKTAKRIADSTKEAKEQKVNLTKAGDVIPKMPTDTAKIRKDQILLTGPAADDDPTKMRREVVDRKFYKGKFDDEIPVELYVRYMRDTKGKVSSWDGLYKFGDMEQYVKLDITKPEDKWLFEEPVGTMELELNNKVYTGSWIGENQTGYDAELTQKEISQKKIELLDKILENGAWGQTDKQPIKENGDKKEGGDKKDDVDKLKHPDAKKEDKTDDAKKDTKDTKDNKDIKDPKEERKAEREKRRLEKEKKKADEEKQKADEEKKKADAEKEVLRKAAEKREIKKLEDEEKKEMKKKEEEERKKEEEEE